MASFTAEDIRLAQETEAKYGVPASVTLAQYALESGYGTSNLARTKNNYFGMRARGGGWQSFSSKAESFDAHGRLLAKPLYSDKTKGTTTVKEYIEAIAETYAPSSDGNVNYAGKILKIINDNNLTQYDSDKWQNFTYTGDTSTASSTGFFGDKISDVGDAILRALVTAGAVILVSVLGVVFFMTAFDLKIPIPAAKAVKTAKKATKAADAVKEAKKAVTE